MARGGHRIERHWRHRGGVSTILWPLATVFGLIGALRRNLYRLGVFPTTKLPVPVIVVGNLTVGGTGKTPLVIALVESLRAAGYTPGVVSGGYRGSYRQTRPWALVERQDAAFYGDEIVLVHERCKIPAAVGSKRARAASALLAAHPALDVILCDDGLQHYGLGRDVEIAVFDERLAGNVRLLPAGPLREPMARLARVDAVVFNGEPGPALRRLTDLAAPVPVFSMRLDGRWAYQLVEPDRRVRLDSFIGKRVLAAAGIGAPERFFATLTQAGLTFARLPLPDHFDFRRDPFQARSEAVILITEKDAVKCRQREDARLWVVTVDAILEDAFVSLVQEKLRARQRPGPPSA